MRDPGPFGSIRASLRPCISQLIFGNIYLGIAEGAFAEARKYTLSQTRPWLNSGVESANQDPYLLQHYGDMHLELRAAQLLAESAGESLRRVWDLGESITEDDRGRCAVDIAATKVATTRVGLEITNRMFEVMGARSTTAAARLDRFWRNLRTHSLHDPVDYKRRELGDWALNGQVPKPTFYS